MRILLTNDDGITAGGLQALWRQLHELGEIYVVAPDREQSGTSQAITVHRPIRVDTYCITTPPICAWQVNGTPTDCVKIAVEALLPYKPDIVVSGINHGPNLGTDVMYSGTVSAAIEAALQGIPAVAISLDTWQPTDFAVSAHCAEELVREIRRQGLPPNTLLNVNVPAGRLIKGIRVTTLGKRHYQNTFERRLDPRGRVYYWLGGNAIDDGNAPESDVIALKDGYISVTPVHFDLTNYKIMDILAQWEIFQRPYDGEF